MLWLIIEGIEAGHIPSCDLPVIVFLINDLSIGGAEKLVLQLCRSNKGSAVLTLFRAEREYYHGDVIRFCLFSADWISCLKLLWKAKAIHFNLWPTQLLVLFFALSRKKLIYTEHNTHNRRRKFQWYRWFEKRVYSRFSNVVAISEGVQQALSQWIESYDIQVIPNGVPSPPVAFADVERNHYQILMVGRFAEQKDQQTLILALNELPCEYCVVLVGTDRVSNISKICPVELSDRVIAYDAVNDVSDFYARAGVYVQSSKWEGFGLTVVEAMAAGLPVVGSDVAGMRTLLHPDFVFDVGDAAGLAQKIRLLEDESFHQAAVEHSKVISDQYSLDRMVDRYAQLYR